VQPRSTPRALVVKKKKTKKKKKKKKKEEEEEEEEEEKKKKKKKVYDCQPESPVSFTSQEIFLLFISVRG
jgi:hypothetical protein